MYVIFLIFAPAPHFPNRQSTMIFFISNPRTGDYKFKRRIKEHFWGNCKIFSWVAYSMFSDFCNVMRFISARFTLRKMPWLHWVKNLLRRPRVFRNWKKLLFNYTRLCKQAVIQVLFDSFDSIALVFKVSRYGCNDGEATRIPITQLTILQKDIRLPLYYVRRSSKLFRKTITSIT